MMSVTCLVGRFRLYSSAFFETQEIQDGCCLPFWISWTGYNFWAHCNINSKQKPFCFKWNLLWSQLRMDVLQIQDVNCLRQLPWTLTDLGMVDKYLIRALSWLRTLNCSSDFNLDSLTNDQELRSAISGMTLWHITQTTSLILDIFVLSYNIIWECLIKHKIQ